MRLEVELGRTNDFIESFAAHPKSAIARALISEQFGLLGGAQQVLSAPLRRCTPLLFVHAGVGQLLEGCVEEVGVGRRFLILLLLREKIGAGHTKALGFSVLLRPAELSRRIVRQVWIVALRVVSETRSLGEAEELLGQGIVGRIIGDLLLIGHTRQHDSFLC